MKIYTLPNGDQISATDQFEIGDQKYPPGYLLDLSDDDAAKLGLKVSTAPDPLPPPIEAITMRQARLALLGAGLLDKVNAAVVAAGPAAGIEWEYAQEIRRDSPLIAQLADGLGLDSATIDSLFMKASQL